MEGASAVAGGAPRAVGALSRLVSPAGLGRALGILWIIDGALKFQPGLAAQGATRYEFAMTAMGSPRLLFPLIVRLSGAFVHHRQLWWMLGAAEIALGLGLQLRRTGRVALIASSAFALVIWMFGEGLDALTQHVASMVTGFPGAALVYGLLSAVLWFAYDSHPGEGGGVRPVVRRAVSVLWAGVWIAAAGFQLAPQLGPNGMDAQLYLQAQHEPPLLGHLGMKLAAVFGDQQHLTTVSVVLAALFLLIALAGVRPALTGPAVLLALLLTAVFWVAGQDFGGLLTGSATDVGTGPAMVLLALAVRATLSYDGPSPRQPSLVSLPGSRAPARRH